MRKLILLAIATLLISFTSCKEKKEMSEAETLIEEMKEDGAEIKIKEDDGDQKIKMETDTKEVKIKIEDGETKIKIDEKN